MLRKKRMFVLYFAVLVIVTCLLYTRTLRSGKLILDYIQIEDITQIVVKKTIENETATEECATFELEPVEIEKFYTVLSDAKVRDIGIQPFPIHSHIRYYVFLNNSDGLSEGTMKFYEDEAVIFDFIYENQPSIHKRYSITSSSFKDFFEAIFY